MASPHTPTCPRCGYDLSGPVPTWRESCPMEGVCPECGQAHRWADAFDGERYAPKWHIEARGLRWSMLVPIRQTLRIALPWRFWGAFSERVPFRPLRVLWFVLWPWIVAGLLSATIWTIVALLNVIPAGMPNEKYVLIVFCSTPVYNLQTFTGGSEFITGFGAPVRIVVLGSFFFPLTLFLLAAAHRRQSCHWRETLRAWLYSAWLCSAVLAAVPLAYAYDGVYYMTRSLLTGWRPTGDAPHFESWTWIIAPIAALWLAAFWFAALKRHLDLRDSAISTISAFLIVMLAGGILEFFIPWDSTDTLFAWFYEWLYTGLGV